MRVSYRWLVRMLGAELPLRELVERLTNLGLEIEAVIDCGIESGKVITGHILEISPHPNAENLVLARVDTGACEPLRIVCGAKNMKPGDWVPVAIEGAALPNGLVIKHSKIRGEESQGMMCSGNELGWSDDHDGLLILPQEDSLFPLGQPFDALLDIKVTPNRPDCLSVFGVARDLSAALGRRVAFPAHEIKETAASVADFARVRVDAPQQCPRYLGRVIRGVKIAPGPVWLQRAVESAGLRSINNVVDVTNYILMELGHPLHAFDLDKVANHEVIIRSARDGEEVQTLDGQVCKMTAADLLITDPEKPIALAGIMGCGNSEITDATTNVFLECAYFDPATIRLTSKRLAKSTDSSYRFERGTDWQNLDKVIDRAARLIVETAGGEIAAGRLEGGEGISPLQPITLTQQRVNDLTGLSLAAEEIVSPLEALGFKLESGNGGGEWLVTTPAHRPDVSRDADLIEEVARIKGYDAIPTSMPMIRSRATAPAAETRIAEVLRDVFIGVGFHECINYSFQAAEVFQKWQFDLSGVLLLQNALSAEYNVMRPHLLPGLIESVLYNQNHGRPDVRLFEVGKTYRAEGSSKEPHEEWEFAAAVSGTADEATWRGRARSADFFDIKAVADEICSRFNVSGVQTVRPDAESDRSILHPGKSAQFRMNDSAIMTLGEIHPGLREKLDLKRDVIVLYGTFKALEPFLINRPQFREIPQFPAVARDLALVVDRSVTSAQIESAIVNRAKNLLAEIRLFDLYEGERVASDKKSLAYQLRFRAADRTLTDDEINKLQKQILGDLKAKLGAELRT